MNKTLKTATRIAAGSALAISAFTVTSLPAQAAALPQETGVDAPSTSNNRLTIAPVIDGTLMDGALIQGPLVDGPLVDGPLVDTGQTGPFQFGQFQ